MPFWLKPVLPFARFLFGRKGPTSQPRSASRAIGAAVGYVAQGDDKGKSFFFFHCKDFVRHGAGPGRHGLMGAAAPSRLTELLDASPEREKRSEATEPTARSLRGWSWLVRRLLRLLLKRKFWHLLGEHLKQFTAIKCAASRRHDGGTGRGLGPAGVHRP